MTSAQTITDTDDRDGLHRHATRGSFVADDGSELPAGWFVNVGFANFLELFTDPELAQALGHRRGLDVRCSRSSRSCSRSALGLLFALIYNDPRVKGRRTMRTLFILPYAFPVFMSALLFRGMFNSEFGVINDLFFFGADINWLGDPWLARGAMLWVNIWLSYPVLVPRVHRCAAVASRGRARGRLRSTARARSQRFRSIILPAAARLHRATGDLVVRRSLQQLHHHLPLQRRRAGDTRSALRARATPTS